MHNIDQASVSVAIINFLVFYFVHIAGLRFTKSQKIFESPFLLLFISLFFMPVWVFIIGPLFIPAFFTFTAFEIIITVLLSLIITTLLIILYIFGIFGMIIESSLRIKLLSLVFEAGNNGIKKTYLLNLYNTDIILKKRIQRLESSGILKLKKNKYYIAKPFPILYIHALIVNSMNQLYKKNGNIRNNIVAEKFLQIF